MIRKHFLVVTNLIFKKLSNPKSTNNNAPFGDDAALVERLTSDGGITFGQHIKYTSGVLQVCIQPSEISKKITN